MASPLVRTDGDGIHMNNCYEDPRVCNSLITYNKATGLNLIACHDIVVSANQFEENLDALRCVDGYNLCMTGTAWTITFATAWSSRTRTVRLSPET